MQLDVTAAAADVSAAAAVTSAAEVVAAVASAVAATALCRVGLKLKHFSDTPRQVHLVI